MIDHKKVPVSVFQGLASEPVPAASQPDMVHEYVVRCRASFSLVFPWGRNCPLTPPYLTTALFMGKLLSLSLSRTSRTVSRDGGSGFFSSILA